MTDLQAGLGLSQLRRYPELVNRRHEIIVAYEQGLADLPIEIMAHTGKDFRSSGHLMLTRLSGKSIDFRNKLIELMAEQGVATNVHYKPLPLLTAYKNMGFDIANFPNAYAQYENEITLPLHTLLSNEDVAYVIDVLHACYAQLESEGIN